MKQERYNLICAMLPYKVKFQYKNRICNVTYMSTKRLALIIDDFGEIWKCNWNLLPKNCKPILTSKLSDEQLLVLGIDITTYPEKHSDDFLITRAEQWIEGKLSPLDRGYVGFIQAKRGFERLYEFHYSFNLDKSLYIEKT